MKNFIEFIIDGQTHIVNIDNIAMIKQLDINTLHVFLLSKEKGEQTSFKLNYPLGDIKYNMTELDKFMYLVPFVVSKD